MELRSRLALYNHTKAKAPRSATIVTSNSLSGAESKAQRSKRTRRITSTSKTISGQLKIFSRTAWVKRTIHDGLVEMITVSRRRTSRLWPKTVRPRRDFRRQGMVRVKGKGKWERRVQGCGVHRWVCKRSRRPMAIREVSDPSVASGQQAGSSPMARLSNRRRKLRPPPLAPKPGPTGAAIQACLEVPVPIPTPCVSWRNSKWPSRPNGSSKLKETRSCFCKRLTSTSKRPRWAVTTFTRLSLTPMRSGFTNFETCRVRGAVTWSQRSLPASTSPLLQEETTVHS